MTTIADSADNSLVQLISTRHPQEQVVFPISPSVQETISAEYNPIDVLHMPGNYHSYKSTKSRNFSITATLISRTSAEGTSNTKILRTLRAWLYPSFGLTNEYKGSPPPLLHFSCYGANNPSKISSNIRRVPVIMTQLNIPYPNDVDYILTTDEERFPVKMDLTISLIESHTPEQFRTFDLKQFKAGTLVGFN